ncbi:MULTISPECIES: hypothetical protein [Kamptonema]|uniref:hypothetical protein n=1 Tax=Kamptonema TaxID=1501433 RepID=UPI0001DAC8B8|nr:MULTISPECIES: hypothetical protein [Kamptonema]CBN58600.1 hypothetical protein OSCI_3850002 [Kamptonema sp. PCC 6506]
MDNSRFQVGAGDRVFIRSADPCSFRTHAFEHPTALKTTGTKYFSSFVETVLMYITLQIFDCKKVCTNS